MKIPELLNLINTFVNTTEASEKAKRSLASSIKKHYNITMHELKVNGISMRIENLRSLISPLMKNYETIKNYNSINEVMQTMAEDLDTLEVSSDKEKCNVEKEVDDIYITILGNPGTTTKGMSSEYISKVIKGKLAKTDGFNKDDVLNVLTMQSQNMYLNIEDYQKLINDSVVSHLTNNPKDKQFSNPKILGIFESLAASFKVQRDFEKAKAAYEQGLSVKLLENTSEYRELQEKYETFLEYLDMKNNFEDKRFNSFQSLMQSLEKTFTNDDIFTKGHNEHSPKTKTKPTTPSDDYVMPIELRLKGIKSLLTELQKIDENIDILECEVGKDAYEGYVILKLNNTNISIFENFTDPHARVFIVKNEAIEQIKPLAKNGALRVEGAEGRNHIRNFKNYCENLKESAFKLIDETTQGISIDDNTFFKDDIVPAIPPEIVSSPNPEGNTVSDNIENDKPEAKPPISNDPLEVERQKAFANREYLQKLTQKAEDIHKQAEQKIANVKKSDGKNSDEQPNL